MGAIHDELHALVDRLDDEQAARFAEQLRAALGDEGQMTPAEWLEKTRAMRAKMREESPGVVTDSVETLREIREERLNDLMRGSGFGDISGDRTGREPE